MNIFFVDFFPDELPDVDFLHYLLLNDSEDFSVQNPAATQEIAPIDFSVEDRAAVQELLEEIPLFLWRILLPGTMEELDQVFFEEFMNLTTMSAESNMNSFNTEPTTYSLTSELERGTLEPVGEFGCTTEVPNATIDTPSVIPQDATISGVFANNNFPRCIIHY